MRARRDTHRIGRAPASLVGAKSRVWLLRLRGAWPQRAGAGVRERKRTLCHLLAGINLGLQLWRQLQDALCP